MNRLITEGLRTLSGGPYSFAAERGECVALSGPSGCGKTLLLRAIADLDPAAGNVFLDGETRSSMSAPQWRRNVGWLPAEGMWWFDSVGDHFINPDPAIRTLEELGFGKDVFNWRIERLSTGEKQRLALFRLLLNQPKVLLLDEPTAALDRANIHLAEEVIAGYRRSTGATVLWVSHDPEQIARVAGHHLTFSNGGLEGAQ